MKLWGRGFLTGILLVFLAEILLVVALNGDQFLWSSGFIMGFLIGLLFGAGVVFFLFVFYTNKVFTYIAVKAEQQAKDLQEKLDKETVDGGEEDDDDKDADWWKTNRKPPWES